MRDTGDKQEPRSEWELMKQNITDAGYQTETGADKLMIMKHKQAIVQEIQTLTGNQWSQVNIGVVCTFGDSQRTRRAVQFHGL